MVITKNNVTPWLVEGIVDYEKLIEEFGVKHLSEDNLKFLKDLSAKKNIPFHLFLKRNLYFSHRDFDKVIESFKKNENIFLYTGRSPGGSMHIGHLVSFLFTKYLQDVFDCNLYIQIPDDEKFLFKKDLNLETIEEMTQKDLLNIAAIGFNPDKTFIFRNSEYIRNMYPLYLKTAKKILLSQTSAIFGFNNQSNIGMINYPALQIVPTFFEKGQCLIPCAIDQDPYFRLQRDIANSLGYKKNSTILSKFIPPLTGTEGKMSATNANKAILLDDCAKEIKNKINKYAFSGGQPTIEEHRKLGGNTKIDVCYQWLYYLFEEDDKAIEKIKNDYEKGILLTGELKKILIDKLTLFIENHQKNKQKVIDENLLEKYMYKGKLAIKMWNEKFL
ncbi:MAG: tryptophan--tRNA ligase [Candidatus Nanoarchaeia archaeon]|nr:tryptophan--tRNA ligase [Candidatus Nanoarchaeia archaeon]